MSDVVGRLNAALSGRYVIERELGEGGMATVYLAKDLKHNRNIALKVLKPELAAVVGAERFLAEIETTANLQHPHILPLFDSGEADSFLFYVMPYVEGETLGDRLSRDHQLPVEDAVQIAKNVAEALDYAHSQGVIHRDIKPANILLQAGKPVIADFGIALAVGAAGGGRLTETGLSMGTPHYMSPEQATGDVGVGATTDIYALGCVLYEMLIGEPPYTGSTAQAVLGKIIAGELASAAKHRATVPVNIDAAIRKALEKVPADRFGGGQEFAKALADPGFNYGASGLAAVTASRGPWKGLAIAMTSAAALLTIALGWTVLRPTPPGAVVRLAVDLGAGQIFAGGINGPDLVLSPDGSRVVYVGVGPDGGSQLFQRAIDELEPELMPDTEGALGPVFSPEGTSVAFTRGTSGGIETVSLGGGPASQVSSGQGRHPAWSSNGMIYFSTADGIKRVPETGGEQEVVTTVGPGQAHRLPTALPDGRGVLFTANGGGFEGGGIAVVGPEGGNVRELLPGQMARYASSGHLVYTADRGTLMAAPFDLKSLEVTGPGVQLPQRVQASQGASQFSLSDTGTLLYTSAEANLRELVWLARDGTQELVDSAWIGNFEYPALAPGDDRVAVGMDGDVWVKSLDGGAPRRLTLSESYDNLPVWKPDGESVTYVSRHDGVTSVWTQPLDGSQESPEVEPGHRVFDALWSPDGEWLIYRTLTASTGRGDILALRPGRGDEPLALVATENTEDQPTLSPNGRWLAYASNLTGTDEIYVVPFPDPGGTRLSVSAGGGSGGDEPRWAHSGRELFYRNGRGEVVAVAVETDSEVFSTGQHEVLFSATEYVTAANHPQYDVTEDDERFLMVRQLGSPNVIWVQNFFEELKARVPNR